MTGREPTPAADERDRQLDQIAVLGRLLLASSDEQEVLAEVARGICEFGRMERCLIAAYSVEDDLLLGRAGWNLRLADVRVVRETLASIPVVREAIETRRVLLVPHPREDRAIPAHYLDLFSVSGSLVVVPLVSSELGVLGVAVVDRGGEPSAPDDDQMRAMAVFADLAAMAMRHGRFVEEGRRLAATVERTRVAAEVHDTLSQSVHATRLALAELVGHPALEGEPRELAERARALADDASSTMHQALAALLEEPARDESPMLERLRGWVEEFGVETGVSVDVTVLGEGPEPSGDVARVLLRTVREGLTNVAKYADATEVVVGVRRGRGWWSVDVADDGAGDATDVRRHLTLSAERFGLASLARDAREAGGRLYVGRSPRLGGISLSVSVPVDR